MCLFGKKPSTRITCLFLSFITYITVRCPAFFFFFFSYQRIFLILYGFLWFVALSLLVHFHRLDFMIWKILTLSMLFAICVCFHFFLFILRGYCRESSIFPLIFSHFSVPSIVQLIPWWNCFRSIWLLIRLKTKSRRRRRKWVEMWRSVNKIQFNNCGKSSIGIGDLSRHPANGRWLDLTMV